MKLLLHIGTGKTGSTSVQRFLRVNNALLRERGVFVPRTLGEGNHRRLPAIVQEDRNAETFMRTHGHVQKTRRDAVRERWKNGFLAEVSEASKDPALQLCIISSEHLSFLQGREIRRLRDLLVDRFASLRILVYLRDPIDYAVSMYDTALKIGGLRHGPLPPKRHGEADYRELLRKWVKVFGREALEVRLFDLRELVGGDVVADFADAAGLDLQGCTLPDHENASLNPLGQALLARVNRRLPRFRPDGRLNPWRGEIHRVFERHFATGPKSTPEPEMVQAYRDVLGPSNEWVRRQFFPERNELFPPRDRTPAPQPGLSDDELDQLAALVVALWTRHRSAMKSG